MELPPLASTVCLRTPLESLHQLAGDTSKVFVAVDMTSEGKQVSSNILYLEPIKSVQLAPAKLVTKLEKSPRGIHLRSSSPVLARDVYASFSDLDVNLSDNYVDILPGQSVSLDVTSTSSLAEIEAKLKVVSLTDAFTPSAPPTSVPPR